MRRLWAGVLIGWAGAAVVGAALLGSGVIDMSARDPPNLLERVVGETLSGRSASVRAPRTKNPVQPTPEVLAAALRHYRQDCLACHGAPGVQRNAVGNGLNPPAPDLVDKEVQKSGDGELFWFIQNGVRMTGMPAWAEVYAERDIWEVVAFVRHLPSLTDEERSALEGERGDARSPAEIQ